MKRLSPDELNDILQRASGKVEVGGVYRHYKGQEYVVEQLAIDEATNEPVVVYRAEYDIRLIFIRPLRVWLEHVEHQGATVPRFTYIGTDLDAWESTVGDRLADLDSPMQGKA